MLSFKQTVKLSVSRLLALTLLPLLLFASGCQVRPLYGTSGVEPLLKAISFSPADDRIEQEVRNNLIFLTSGGAGEAVAPQYDVDLIVKERSVDVLVDQSDDRPRAGRIVLVADFSLKKHVTGEVIRSGQRSSVALVDYSKQEFAKIRAIRDAQNRAARELAELIRADLSGWLGR